MDESNGVASVNWPAWTFCVTALNNKGVYTDLHDGGGPTKPKKQDADLTNYTIVADLNNLQLWGRLPPLNTD